ncbi:hypothetical protein A3Q56_07223 [Intoshia linei]|uniref:Uncharacterized protein n=1 Tax=Intoshia linei TaxID=1819745 RepID=A0A177AU71_9BILA|nr:hypothetical protein A3Q56_07223 [Intoshia linei]
MPCRDFAQQIIKNNPQISAFYLRNELNIKKFDKSSISRVLHVYIDNGNVVDKLMNNSRPEKIGPNKRGLIKMKFSRHFSQGSCQGTQCPSQNDYKNVKKSLWNGIPQKKKVPKYKNKKINEIKITLERLYRLHFIG